VKNFDWKAGFRRAAIFILLYAAILYIMNTAFPETFGIAEGQLPSILIQGVFFFLILAVFFSWTEKRRRQRIEELRARKQGQQNRPESDDEDPGPLKGKPNPNTSRKKARRRR
jgi:flagellar biosynthesis/type III secretory pathway M-ring protein FliF/YscJ